MIALSVWFLLLGARLVFDRCAGWGGPFFNQIERKAFFVLILFFGFLNILKIIDVSGFYFLNNSFNETALSNQIGQCFILVPLIALFSFLSDGFNSKEGHDNDNIMLLFAVATTTALGSYNLNVIFAVFIFFEFFSIEMENKILKGLRREAVVILIVLFPFISEQKGILPGILFLLLIILSAFDLYAFGQEKGSGVFLQFRNMVLLLPLRMTLLAYYASGSVAIEYLSLGKLIFLSLIVISCLYGIFSAFNLKSRLIISQILLLASTLSVIGHFYMELYFLLGLFAIYSALENHLLQKNIKWFLMGPILIILLSLLDGSPGLIKILISALEGEGYSKVIGISLLLFLTLLSFQWGQVFKKVDKIKIRSKEKYYILALLTLVFLNAKYNTLSGAFFASGTSKIIVSFYFIIILLISYIVKFPVMDFKKVNGHLFKINRFLENGINRILLFNWPEKILHVFWGSLLSIAFFIQEIVVNLFFILVESYECKNVKKYQYVAILLLITFLFLWIKVFVSAK